MARIAGINIPNNKRFVISLTYIHGIGLTRARQICKELKIGTLLRTSDVDEATLFKVRDFIKQSGYLLEGDLKREVQKNIKKLVSIGCIAGIRHTRRLPVRGQRTHTNARTRKGKRTAVAGKKKVIK